MYVLLFVGTIAYAFLCMRENMFILYMIVGLRKDSLYVGDSFAGTCQPNYSWEILRWVSQNEEKSVFVHWVAGSCRWKATYLIAPLLGWPNESTGKLINLHKSRLEVDYDYEWLCQDMFYRTLNVFSHSIHEEMGSVESARCSKSRHHILHSASDHAGAVKGGDGRYTWCSWGYKWGMRLKNELWKKNWNQIDKRLNYNLIPFWRVAILMAHNE